MLDAYIDTYSSFWCNVCSTSCSVCFVHYHNDTMPSLILVHYDAVCT